MTEGAGSGGVRVAVIIPCYSDGPYVLEAIDSIQESEPIEIVVVDDASPDPATAHALAEAAARGARVERHPQNRGAAAARQTGFEATRAPYVFPLDADDLAGPGVLGRLADLLDAAPDDVGVAYGDYAEFGEHHVVRAIPEWIDPYRLAYAFDYPPAALFRRKALEEAGGWRPAVQELFAYEDWHLWMGITELGYRGVHLGPGEVTYRRRIHGERLLTKGRRKHRQLYLTLRRLHPRLFSDLRAHRRRSDMSATRKLLYPVVYGGRPRFGFERRIRFLLDRAGIWTLNRDR